MTGRLIIITVFSWFCILSVFGQNAREGRHLLDDETFQARHDLGKSLNSQHRYMEAYKCLDDLHKDIVRSAGINGIDPSEFPSVGDFIFYQSVLVTKVQCAYMLHLWKEMKSICDEQLDAFNDRYDAGLGTMSQYYHNVASFYKARGDYYYLETASDPTNYEYAEKDYKYALEYFQKTDDKLAISKIYAELAQLEYSQTNYMQAKYYINAAIELLDDSPATGSNSKHNTYNEELAELYLTYRQGLAMCMAQCNDFDNALDIINEESSLLSKNDSHMPELKRKKAKILMLKAKPEPSEIQEASSLYEEYFKHVKQYVADNFMQMTADQREEYWMHQRPFAVDCYMLEENSPELLYDVTLYNKGMLLQTARSFDNLLYDEKSKGKDNERRKLMELRQMDYKNTINGKTSHYAEDYEQQLLKTMKSDGRYKKFLTPLNYTWRDIQKVLPADGCAIEFVEYDKWDEMNFGAIVVRKTGRPVFVKICNADDLAAYYPEDSYFTLRTLLSSTNSMYKDLIYEDREIASYIWPEQLVSVIGDCTKVYFSPDGYLHQLAIEYLLPESLQDKSFYRLSSTRVLAEGRKVNASTIRSGKALILGGIDYESLEDEEPEASPGNDSAAYENLRFGMVYFSYMDGARIECDSIMYYRNNPGDKYLKGLEATEQAFYENCTDYPIMHLSTHGTFDGDNTISSGLFASSSKDVLSYSTMALSYVQTNLDNPMFDSQNKDGLLSAREVARLNLSNVELVTTSACQTGLGYITADGIYGMQRGFKSAGVKGMVMTLWSVNIESARIFFTEFYHRMAIGETVHQAFTNARNDLLTKKYPEPHRFSKSSLSSVGVGVASYRTYNTPYHCNPYILIDVWE